MSNTGSIWNRPRIAVTCGEPAGIGPDVIVQAVQRPLAARLVVIGDVELLGERAAQLGLPLQTEPHAARAEAGIAAIDGPGAVRVLPVPLAVPASCGRLDPRNASYVIETLRAAALGCLSGCFDAMVTAPVHKSLINDAGIPFSGHTEFLAELCGGDRPPVMMLCTPGLRVALATTHVPLRYVSAQITRERVLGVLEVLARDLDGRFRIQDPCIAVCGLNPHAGEGGYLGTEETTHIAPAIELARARGIRCSGPHAADTLFIERNLEGVDAVLCMYHDQGLPVLKHRGFGQAVNITLGLPLIRTSVDHGTALDLAGTGRAECGSLVAAIEVAAELAVRSRLPHSATA